MNKILPFLILTAFGAGCLSAPTSIAPPPSAPAATAPASASTTATTTAPAPVKAPTTTKPKVGTTSNSLQPSAGTTKPGPATITVNISATGFSPQVVAVNAGDTVKWVNKDTGNHTVMSSASALWNSGNIPPGTSYARKFSAVGSYTYVDGAHPSVGGTVVVH